jgi:cell division protein FtsZ
MAISSPLLEESVEGATGILLNITGGKELGLFEVNEAAETVNSAADSSANIIFGAVIDDSLGDEVRVTVIATGFEHRRGGELFRRRRSDEGRSPRRDVVMEDRERRSLEISEDEIDVPPFLRNGG